MAFADIKQANYLILDLEGHGREHVIDDIDLSRTVGWFTSIFPVCLEVSKNNDFLSIIRSVKHKLRNIPNKGIGYGLLKYLTPDQASNIHKIKMANNPLIAFNYLGQFDSNKNTNSLLSFAEEWVGDYQEKNNVRVHTLDIDGVILNGSMSFDWVYGKAFYAEDTIQKLAEAFKNKLILIIGTIPLLEKTATYVPSDFPLLGLNPKEFEKLISEHIKILDPKLKLKNIYPLSPMQQGLLFQELYAKNSGNYIVQQVIELKGTLDEYVLKKYGVSSLIDMIFYLYWFCYNGFYSTNSICC